MDLLDIINREESNRYQFTVVMPNLNYDVPRDGTQDGTQEKLNLQIVELICRNAKQPETKLLIKKENLQYERNDPAF